MPPKVKLQPPIDRPLSRAYLRQFTGWSTAFPPGLSEPTSLRIMENMMVNRDGSLRVRPGLKYLSYDGGVPLAANLDIVGSHEAFFLNDGTKAYLFAVKQSGVGVTFRVAKYLAADPEYVGPAYEILTLTDPEVGFATAPPAWTSNVTYVKYLQIDNKILALNDNGEAARLFTVGATKTWRNILDITRPDFTPADKPKVFQPDGFSVVNPSTTPPLTNHVTTPTALTLLTSGDFWSTDAFKMGYFYTFSNEFGESAPSMVTTVTVRRPWVAWLNVLPNGGGEPTGGVMEDPAFSADQLNIYPSSAAYTAAIAAGATHFNVYGFGWSDQDPTPVEGVLVESKPLTGAAYADFWVRHGPTIQDGSRSAPIPAASNRRDYSAPPTAAQGIVAADRMVLVNDPSSGAVVRWTSNRLGEYTNFTASRGGGYKTLTSGNLNIPVCVALWQNPQSADTLIILCLGVDGYGSSFYMAPAQVASQSDATNIMGFEETTATPGTVSPFGCEVLNNALYHPLESELIKSTASNYNINHKTMTDLIRDNWIALRDKDQIVSCQLDNRLYYIVHNPAGEALEAGCWGNEIWVLDTANKTGTWSRWLVQAHSLRKVELGGRIVMSVIRPDGIFCFDETLSSDEYVSAGTVVERNIPWRIETNTQGANRAHDAWAHLQQVSATFGNLTGTLRFGIRGRDLNGKDVDLSKQVTDNTGPPADGLPFDIEDHLQVRRQMKEWHFYAESVTGALDVVLPSSGQINMVQYRYTPISVNVGYEYGSVETFEYGRDVAGGESTSENGVPIPVLDNRRP